MHPGTLKYVPNLKFCQSFGHLKIRPFQQCLTVTAVNLFYELLPKQFEAFGFHFSQAKKNRRLLIVGYSAWNHTLSWQITTLE